MKTHATIEDAEQSIIEEFGFFDSWTERYEYIIELGRQLPDLPAAHRIDAYKVPGCQSQVWFVARSEAGRIHFEADSDAMIVRGLIAILRALYSGQPLAEISRIDAQAELGRLGLDQHLSSQRSNGLKAMVRRLNDLARVSSPV